MNDTQLRSRLRRCYQVHHVNVDALIERAERERRYIRLACGAGIAAIIALLALLPACCASASQAPRTYATVEEQQLIGLDDGSVVALNVQSEMRVALSAEARDLYFNRGQGIIRVRHDARRPFRVHLGTAVVETADSQFDVRMASDRMVITVIKGPVNLRWGPSTLSANEENWTSGDPQQITAGQSATIRGDGQTAHVDTVDVAAVTAWRQPAEQLRFKYRSLAEVAEELNSYNATPKLRIEGETLRERRFICLMLNSSSPQSLLNYLVQDDTLEIVEEGDDILIRERTAK